MSNYNRNYYDYNKYSSRGRGRKTREIIATDEMLRLVSTSRICTNAEGDTIYIYNGSAKPIKAPLGDALTTATMLKQGVMDLFRVREAVAIEWCGLLSDLLLELEEKSDLEEDNKIRYYIQKYTKGILPVESILIGERSTFLQIIDGKAVLSKEIQLPDSDIILCPLDKVSYLSKEYSFGSESEINGYIKRAQNETLDTLYNRVKSIFKKYADRDDSHIVICVADIIFTYFQDKLGMTHYLLFVGDNDVGKTGDLTVIQQLAYRALCDISITPANIYRFLGSVEEGQGVILEDEIDDIDEQKEKMKIYKGGYIGGKKVTRNDDTPSGRKSQGYWTYCFKAFTSEKQPDSVKAKGFNERIFVLKCSPGCPEYDISEVINPAGDEDYKAQLDELVDTRKLLLIYRLLHHDQPIPNIDLTLKNRDKQLCKPVIRLFQGTGAVEEIKKSLSKLLKEKKGRKAVTIEAILYSVVNSLVKDEVKKEQQEQTSLDKDVVILSFGSIWNALMNEVEGTVSPKNSRSMDTSEYGLISQQNIGSILRDRFGGDDARDKKTRKLRFGLSKLEKLGYNYSSVDNIEIKGKPTKKTAGDPGDQGDLVIEDGNTFDSSRDVKSGSNDAANHENVQEKARNDEDISSQEFEKESPPSTTRSPRSPRSPVASPQVSSMMEHSANQNMASGPENNPQSQAAKADNPGVQHTAQELQPLTQDAIDEERARRYHDLPVPEILEDGLPVVKEEELEHLQSSKPITPIEIEDFFSSSDMPLPGHGLEESPCRPIIDTRPGESGISTDTVYYCRLHPELGSTFLTQIEWHCIQKEPDIHKAEILRVLRLETGAVAAGDGST